MLKAAINAQELEVLIKQNDLVLVDFWADWCAPCKQFATVYERMAQQNPDLVFAKIDVAQETELAQAFHIRSIPHLMIFKQGIVIYSDSGSLPESSLAELIKQAIAADVKSIREAIDKDDGS
ncbi:thioredoxin [Legionella beliardensis]|uniref:Thioredoxin n=1 Tax=Legionella beliardensis TaxID=91822 RepID=A0A378I0P3_9GAMM|nr:thioredoxin family protein [Legionella beliardensis]STX28767.1 thioredoxin [Legionella beliardensis]